MKRKFLALSLVVAMLLAMVPAAGAAAADVKQIPEEGLIIQAGIDYTMGSGGGPVQNPVRLPAHIRRGLVQ